MKLVKEWLIKPKECRRRKIIKEQKATKQKNPKDTV